MEKTTELTEETNKEQMMADLAAQQKAWAAQRKEWAARETVGERFEVPRKGEPSVSTILYRPSSPAAKKTLPVMFHMHGGAWVGGDAVLLESFCQLLADELPAVIVNINYKKADVHPLPYQITEVADTVQYFAGHASEYGIDRNRMAVGGHSAGAQLAAGAALKLKDEGVKLACQMLVYPATDMTDSIGGLMDQLRPILFPDGGWDSPYVSPLQAEEEKLRGLAPAVFVICGPDMLRPQGIGYAKRLIDAGVSVTVKEYPEAEHGFLEVNRPDYTQGDDRQNPQQAAFARDCERYLIRELKAQLDI